MQVIVMTSDRPPNPLTGFTYLWRKYFDAPDNVMVVCGFTKPDNLPPEYRFVSMGNQDDFPKERWSERLITILDEIADDIFILMLDDYWLKRPVDTRAIKMAYDYMVQFQTVIKFDLTHDRLYANSGGQYLWGNNTYNNLGYLDLIKSDPGSPYHMSLWGGIWRRELMRKILVKGETAQQIEINGTHRLGQFGDEMLVIGTRQAPMLHINAIQGRDWNRHEISGLGGLCQADVEAMKALGYEW